MASKIPASKISGGKPSAAANLAGNGRRPNRLCVPPSVLAYNGKRYASPEPPGNPNRDELRRSRSAVDLRRPNFRGTKFAPGSEMIAAIKAQVVPQDKLQAAEAPSFKVKEAKATSTAAGLYIPRPTTSVGTQLKRQLPTLPEKCFGSTVERFKPQATKVNSKRINQRIALNDYKARFEDLEGKHKMLKAKFEHMREENCELLSMAKNVEEERRKFREQMATLEEKITFLQEDNDKKNKEGRKMLHTVMDMRGNIRVFCRVRPLLPFEKDRLECSWTFLDQKSIEIGATDGANKRMFSFDHVFQSETTQEDIFESIAPLIQSALEGYNICIFAYGQTGSGKTFTMDGVPGELGVIPRTVDLIFNSMEEYKRLGWEYELRVTLLSINDTIYDLLDSSSKDLEIRLVNAKTKTEVYVSNSIEVPVITKDQLHQLIKKAKSNRTTAVGNECSSRSHVFTKIHLIGTHKEKGEQSVGSINLVDLAGSESPKTSARMDDNKHIKRSLSELRNVILALSEKKEHVPYRNSKLTYLLMPCLGGNCKTLMIVNISPVVENFNETVNSLQLASQVNSCKLPKVRQNKIKV